jgi:hypothetical protein
VLWRRLGAARSSRLVASGVAAARRDQRTAEVVEAKSRIETALTTVEAQARRLEVPDRARGSSPA